MFKLNMVEQILLGRKHVSVTIVVWDIGAIIDCAWYKSSLIYLGIKPSFEAQTEIYTNVYVLISQRHYFFERKQRFLRQYRAEWSVFGGFKLHHQITSDPFFYVLCITVSAQIV